MAAFVAQLHQFILGLGGAPPRIIVTGCHGPGSTSRRSRTAGRGWRVMRGTWMKGSFADPVSPGTRFAVRLAVGWR